MATYTVNYGLKKPAASEYYNIKDFNDNADTIDAKLKVGEEAKALADTLNVNMNSAQNNINKLLQKSVIVVEIWAPPNTQVTLEKGDLSFSGTVGSTMELLAPVSALGVWDLIYIYANKTYAKEVRIDNVGYNIVLAAPSLAASPWAYIAKVSEAGMARKAYALGDAKSVTSSMGTYDMQIIGFDHDFYSAVRAGHERVGLTFQMKTATAEEYAMDSNYKFSASWETTDMRTTVLPEILQSMPSDLQSVIKQVSKYTAQSNGLSGKTTTEKLFLFSDVELSGVSSITSYSYSRMYEYYQTGHTPYRSTAFWLRNNQAGANAKENFLTINTGSLSPMTSRCDNQKAICLGFCV